MKPPGAYGPTHNLLAHATPAVQAERPTSGTPRCRVIEAVPYKVHTVLTDNGTHFTTPGNVCSAAKDIRAALDAGEIVWAHAFELACARADIDHRLTKALPPLDQQPGRADEPHDQGRHRAGLPLPELQRAT